MNAHEWNLCVYTVHIAIAYLIFVIDPSEAPVINYILEPNVYSGIYNFTVYISLRRQDPLLLATLRGFQVLLNKIDDRGFPIPFDDNDVNREDNKVIKQLYFLHVWIYNFQNL